MMSEYSSENHVRHEQKREFDVFISHSSQDKSMARELITRLKKYRLNIWYDEDELPPGVPWQELLERGIRLSRSVAVLVGKDGLGPWENEEMQAALQFAVRDKRPVIPVLLPDAPAQPDLPLFLAARTWVDLRVGFDSRLLDRLVWGITGVKPKASSTTGSLNRQETEAGDSGHQDDSLMVWKTKLDYLQTQEAAMPTDDQKLALTELIEDLEQRICRSDARQQATVNDHSNRSVSIGGNVSGGAIVLGDHNVTSLRFTQTALPSASAVDIRAELNVLRILLANLQSEDAKKIERAMEDAQDEAIKPDPDPDEIGAAVARALEYAQQAGDFAEQAARLQSHVTNVVSRLGSSWTKLLTMVGLTL
jgi:hypothetical protein